MLQTSVGTVVALGSEAHSSTIATTSLGLLVVGAAGVPRKTDEDGAIAAVVVVVLLLEAAGDLVVHLLVVFLGGVQDLGGSVRGLEEVVCATGDESAHDGAQGRFP